jgi:hypothetical protein
MTSLMATGVSTFVDLLACSSIEIVESGVDLSVNLPACHAGALT